MPSTSPSTTTSRPHVQRRTVVRRSLTLAGLAVFGLPGLAFAQTPAATGSWIGPFAVIAAARQPGAAARIQTAMIIGLALIESLAIYTLVIALILLFVKGIQFS